MARLTIEQVAAPNFSGTADMLRLAGESFNTGMDSAQGLLGKYQEGQMAKNDNAILNDIAKLGSEDELNAYLNSDALMGKNFSPDMQKTILGLRKGVIGYGQDRANVDSTLSATSRANAGEARTAAEYLDGVNARTELRGLTGLVTGATEEGRTYGKAGPGTVQGEVYSGLIARGLSPEVAEGFMMNFQDESGFNIGIEEGVANVHGTKGKGLYQLTGPRRDEFESVYGNDYSIDNQLDFMMAELNSSESAAGAKIFGAKTAGEAGAAIVSEFLRPAEEHRVSRSSRYMNGSGSYGSTPITSNPTGGAAGTALADAIKNSIYLTPDQALGLLQTGYDAQTSGQTEIDAAERKRVDEQIASQTITALQDPNNLTDTAVTNAALSFGGNLSAKDRLAAAQSAGDLARGSFAGVVAPAVAPDPGVSAALTAANERDAAAANLDPAVAAVQAAETFEATGDVASALIESAGGLDEASGLSKNYVQDQIKNIAKTNGISEAQAAATLDDLRSSGISLEDALTGNSPEMNEAINTRAQDLYGPEALEAASQKRLDTQKASDSRAAAELQLTTAQSRAAKLLAGSPEREAAEAQISNLKDTLLAQKTPQELDQMFTDYVRNTGMASRLEGLSPDDPDFTRAMMQLEETIKVDKSLSDGEKELLIKKLRG